MNDWHETSIEAKKELIPSAVKFVEEVMAASKFDRRRILEVQLAVEEAFTNTALHGYRGNKGIIRICSREIDDGMEMVIEDDGLPFD
ncbi:MAG TPA: ATP-binding protein, partial [Methanotrichaceae archaeon]|nr:ATP-binding protein [Methanotrichaceae archaeon]